MNDQVFNLIVDQNRQTHDLLREFKADLVEVRKDFHAHIADDAKMVERVKSIETTLSNFAWACGTIVALAGVVVVILAK